MERKKLYIHIGMFKTGTSAVQYFLHDNMERLHDQGVLYPKAGRHPHSPVQHGLIGEAFVPEPLSAGDFTLPAPVDRQSVMKALLDEIEASSASRIILSTEILCTLPPDGIRELGQWLETFDVVPIVYFRNFADQADASYQTRVVHNMTIAPFGDQGFENWVKWDLVAMCRNWSAIAHDGKILVQDYDDPDERDSIQSFARMTELDLKRLGPARRETRTNKSLSPTLVVLKSELRRQGVPKDRVDRLLRYLRHLDFSERQTMVPPGLGRDLRRAYAKQLGLLAASDFVVGLDAVRLGREPQELPEKIQIPNLVEALFSIGRAVDRMKQS